MADHSEKIFRIAVSDGKHRGRIKNRDASWGKFCARFEEPFRDDVTLPEYMALPKEDQDTRKAKHGFYVGGHYRGTKRKAARLIERTIISLDADDLTPDQLDDLRSGLSPLCKFEFVAHSSRKHTAEKPRLRLNLLPDKAISNEQYPAVARILAAMIGPTEAKAMDAVDEASFRVNQLMYWPSTCKDAEYVVFRNAGALVDAAAVLDGFDRDWQDYTQLPRSAKRSAKRPSNTGGKAEDPRDKEGIIGAFCRTYDIYSAIETFLPDIYKPGERTDGQDRYTYVAGTGANGAVVYDEGLFLYSHHSTDPCCERLVNAFDLVRIHLFGDQDKEADEDTPSRMPSFKAMAALIDDDAATTSQRADDHFENLDEDDVGNADEPPIGSTAEEKPYPNEAEDPIGNKAKERDIFEEAQKAEKETDLDILAVLEAVEATAEDAPLEIDPEAVVLGEAKSLPRRDWLYGRSYIRKVITATIAPGGVGKSSLVITECLAKVTGREILKGEQVRGDPILVWYHNQEDNRDELMRRIHAAAKHHGIEQKDIGDRLYVTGSDSPKIVVATSGKNGVTINKRAIKRVFKIMREKKIDVFVIDPFVSTHRVPENDNNQIEAVVSIFRTIAERTGSVIVDKDGKEIGTKGSAVGIVHHTRKMGSGQSESVAEDARGAVALIAAARVARVLNRMPKKKSDELGLEHPWLYFRVDNGKANLAPPNAHAVWRRLVSVDLENESAEDAGDSDKVQAVETWEMVAFDDGLSVLELNKCLDEIAKGQWRENVRAEDWVGNCIAKVLGLELPANKEKVKEIIKSWREKGLLGTETRLDAQRKEKTFVVVKKRMTVDFGDEDAEELI
jgi:hypothetical protein